MDPCVVLLEMPCTIVNWYKSLLESLLIALGGVSSSLRRLIVAIHDDEVGSTSLPDGTPYHDRNIRLYVVLEVYELSIPLLRW